MAEQIKEKMYVANRDITVRSTRGFTYFFEKDVPQPVNPIMRKEVLQYGIVPVDGDPELPTEAKETRLPDPIGEERDELLRTAMREMKMDNDRASFTAAGFPKLTELRHLVGFEVQQKERDALWPAIRNEED